MAVNRSVKARYVSSTLTLGAILMLLTSCGGAYVGRDQVVAMSWFKTYVKVCRPVSEGLPVPVGKEWEVEKPETTQWVGINETIEAIPRGPHSDIPVVAFVDCLEIGNNTPPQGFWAHLFEFLASAAPVVGLAFGVPAL